MVDFNSTEYEHMIGDLIHDTFYVERSNRGKISGIRQFSEVLVRKILNIGSDQRLTLGNVGYMEKFKRLPKEEKEYLDVAIEKIRPLGNDGTHTQYTAEFSNDELNQVKDGLFDLYAYLFIDYFLRYPMQLFTPHIILRSFSLLPPIIRYKTLKYLYNCGPNIQIANRYCLSIIKTEGKEKALVWLTNEKDNLCEMDYPTEGEIKKYILSCPEVSPGVFEVSLDLQSYNNAYDLLYSKICDPNTSVNEKGKLYSNFEEAKEHYKKNNFLTPANCAEARILYKKVKQSFSNNLEKVRSYYMNNNLAFPENGEETYDEYEEFGKLMEFVYIGRESR
jgi:hypothetical protein